MAILDPFKYTDGIHDVLAAYINALLAGNLRGELTNTETISATKTLTNDDCPIQNLTPSGAHQKVLLAPEAAGNHHVFFRNASATYNLVIKDDSDTTTFATILPLGTGWLVPMGGTTWAASTGITDHGALSGLGDDDHTQYVRHNLSTAVNNFLVGSGSNTWIKKTLAEVLTILGIPTTAAANDFQVGDGAGAWVKKTLAQTITILRASLDSIYGNTAISGVRLLWNSTTSIDVGTGKCWAENGDLIDITSAITKSSLSLSASTWYHIYVYLSGGSPAGEVVTTAPAAWKGTAYSKTGDTSRRYVGSILTDGSSNVKCFVHFTQSGYMTYSNFRSDTSPHRALNGGTATSATAVALTGIIPVTALLVYMRLTNLADKSLYTSENNSVSSTQNTVALTPGNTATQSAFLAHPMDGSQQIWYVFASAVGVGAAYLDVLGYHFRR